MKQLLAMAALLMVLPWQAARAETQTFGRYEVHYIIFASDFLRPEIARAYGIVRANDRAVLNVAVRRREPAGGSVPIKARVEGTQSDLIHTRDLALREVIEEDAIYYLAEFPFSNDETRYFKLRIHPDGDTSTLDLQFKQTLYVD
jgi:Domain of unknown function (DUF4426)